VTNRSETIKKRVLDNAREYFPGLDCSKLEVDCTPFSQKSTYPLYRCRLLNGSTMTPVAGVIVKFAPVFPGHNEGLTEYEHLELMTKSLGTDGDLRVPRPLDFYHDLNALATEEAGGQRFSAELVRDASVFASRDTGRRLHRIIEQSGRWLAEFHRATSRGAGHPFDEGYRDGVRRKLRAIRPFGFPSHTAGLVERTLDELAAGTAGEMAPFADLHGDFGPQNIHVGDDWVCVFDLSYNRAAVVFDDITYFLVTLETLNPFPRHPFFSRRKALALREPFLRGYFGSADLSPGDQLLLEGFYLKALVYRSVKQRRNACRRPLPVKLAFDRTRIARYYPRRITQQCELISKLLKSNN
jgi:hypothetical protein